MWEVIGYECRKSEDGVVLSYTVHCVRPYADGAGFGQRTCSEWFNAERVHYVPMVGDRIHIDKEQRGKYLMITDIYVM